MSGPTLATLLRDRKDRLLQQWILRVFTDPAFSEVAPREPRLLERIPALFDRILHDLDAAESGRAIGARRLEGLEGLEGPAMKAPDRYELTAELRELSHFRAAILDLCAAEGVVLQVSVSAVVHAAIDESIAARAVQTEQAREEAQRRRADLFEQSHDAVVVWKLGGGGIVSWNRGAEELYGWSAAEVVGRVTHELFQTEVSTLTGVEELEAAIAREGRWDGELHHIARDGRKLVVEARVVAVQRDGSGVLVMEINRDVTERKRAEAALRDSEERFRMLAANAPDVVYRYRVLPTPAYEYVSPSTIEISGYSPEEFYANPDLGWNVVHPEDRHLAEAVAAGSKEPVIMRLVRKDGRVVWVEQRNRPTFDAAGRVVAIDGISRDVTARRQLDERRARHLAAATALAEAISVLDVAKVVVERGVYAIGAAAGSVALLSHDGAELEIVEPVGTAEESLEAFRRFPATASSPLAEAARTGEPVFLASRAAWVERFPAVLPSAPRHGAWAAIPLAARGRVIGALGLSFDEERKFAGEDRFFMLTLAQQCAQALDRALLFGSEQEARVAAETESRAKDEFLATVSHELRTPLNAILGWTQILLGRELPDETRQAVNTIQRNARIQTRLVEDILDASRIVTGKLRFDAHPIELIPLVQAVIESQQPAADAKGIRLSTELDPEAGPVLGDPHRLQQVIWNLVSNALKFTPQHGAVAVALEKDGEQARLLVRDTGMGIEPGFIPFVFQPFRQADASTSRRHAGLGLGLSIVRHLVQLHGGTVGCESRGPGQGSTFMVCLPVAPPGSAASGAYALRGGPAAEPLDDLRGARVLVVDDEPHARVLLAKILAERGAVVRACASAKEALDDLAMWRPDVLVSDIGMPENDGYWLIQRVRALPKERGGATPALALTAYTSIADRVRALSCGYQLHAPKPLEVAELVASVAALLGPPSAA